MRTTFYLISFLLLGCGILALIPGLVALIYSYVAPIQPPPSMNEGPGLARFIGWFLVPVGASSSLIGVAIIAALHATRPPHETADWAGQHKRLW